MTVAPIKFLRRSIFHPERNIWEMERKYFGHVTENITGIIGHFSYLNEVNNDLIQVEVLQWIGGPSLGRIVLTSPPLATSLCTKKTVVINDLSNKLL